MERKLKSWQGWLLFIGAMVVVFAIGMCVAALMERRAEVASVFNNRRTPMSGIVARNDLFKDDFPREYNTWEQTADTTFESEFNGSQAKDVLAMRPAMVIFWAGYAFSRDYTSPRGHMHAIEDMRRTLRTGTPGVDGQGDIQPGTCWTCKSPDVPRMMQEIGVAEFYKSKWSALGAR